MELGQSTVLGLAIVGDDGGVDDPAFESLTEAAVKAALQEDAEGLLAEVALDSSKSKPAFQALTTFLLEAAKFNSQETELTSVLEEVGISRRAGYLIGIVNRERDAIRELLLKTTFHFQKVLDVQWRVDHSVRTKYQDQIGEPSFLISIITAGGEGAPDGQRQEVKFACSKEELQDLVAKLKDACTQVDRILGTSRK